MATTTISRADHGRRMTLAEYCSSDFQEGLYELARGVIEVTEVLEIEHGRIIGRVARLFMFYDRDHPGLFHYQAGKAACCIRLPGLQSSRCPDQAIYLHPAPPGDNPWTRWIPQIVVEVIDWTSTERDYTESRYFVRSEGRTRRKSGLFPCR